MCVRGLSACLRPGASVDRSVGEANPVRREERHSGPGQVSLTQLDYMAEAEEVSEMISRSEERRVGKECRYRWLAYHYIKNRSSI